MAKRAKPAPKRGKAASKLPKLAAGELRTLLDYAAGQGSPGGASRTLRGRHSAPDVQASAHYVSHGPGRGPIAPDGKTFVVAQGGWQHDAVLINGLK